MGKVKIKTNKAAAKRFNKTSTGKIKRGHSLTSHILTKKTTKRKRKLRKADLVSKADVKNVHKMIPYK